MFYINTHVHVLTSTQELLGVKCISIIISIIIIIIIIIIVIIIRQEIEADPKKKVQATSAETLRRPGAVPDWQQNVSQLLSSCSHLNGPARNQ